MIVVRSVSWKAEEKQEEEEKELHVKSKLRKVLAVQAEKVGGRVNSMTHMLRRLGRRRRCEVLPDLFGRIRRTCALFIGRI